MSPSKPEWHNKTKWPWNKRFHWEHDPSLQNGWKRIAEAAGDHAKPANALLVYAAFVTIHMDRVGHKHLEKYIDPPAWGVLAEKALINRRWVKAVFNALVNAGLIEEHDGGFRPNHEVRDDKTGWENARHLFERLPERRRAPKVKEDDPAAAIDSGPCADCGREMETAFQSYVRHMRKKGERVRWAHGSVAGGERKCAQPVHAGAARAEAEF
jgi:hypothetical protein